MLLTRSITALISFLLASLSLGQDWYQIEVIIFEHSAETQAQQSPENWPNDLNLQWPQPLIELEPEIARETPAVIKPAFEELVFEERNMNNDSYALRVRSAYDLLWHKAWRAPLQPEEQAPWILVQASEQIGDHYRLEGGIRIHLSRYLHLHTDLWLTEVSGDPIIDEPIVSLNPEVGDVENVLDEVDISQLALALNAEARFDWSQLPELGTVRWGCNHIRENWPEDQQLIPADFYEDPAPADWYFPFGCRIPLENPSMDIPLSISYPTSDRFYQAELERLYPELFSSRELPLAEDLVVQPEEEQSTRVTEPLNKEQILQQIEIEILDREQEPLAEEEQLLIAPKIRYQVDEIVHIQSQRRMRSGEYHYIDHPKIGVLAIIYPVEKPELDLEADSLEALPAQTEENPENTGSAN